jgi:hypothetical protein
MLPFATDACRIDAHFRVKIPRNANIHVDTDNLHPIHKAFYAVVAYCIESLL